MMAQREALDHWVAVGTSPGLIPQSVLRARIGDHDLAVWRGADGAVRAWENRCPHRGMRLSFGFVRGSRLTCLYHGWTYEGEGNCVAIPAHPKLTPPKTIKVGRFACVERAGLIWVASMEASLPTPSLAGDWSACRSISIDVAPAALARALLDIASLPGAVAGEGGTTPGGEPAGARASQPWRNVIRLDAVDGGRSLLCAVQPVDVGASMLHLSCAGKDGEQPAVRRSCSDWAKRLRRDLEAQAALGPVLAPARAAESARQMEVAGA